MIHKTSFKKWSTPLIRQVVEINFLTKTQEINEYLTTTIMEINNANAGSGKKKSIYILGRYKHHKPNLDSILPFLRNCTFEFKTVHSSKGLQADYVILLGLNSGSVAHSLLKKKMIPFST